MNRTKTLACVALAAGSMLLTGCRTSAQTGSLIGAGLGAVAGRAIGVHNGNRTAGTLIGGAIGALGGYAVGNEIDKEDRGTRYEGDPRYEPGAYDRGYPRERRRVYYYDDGYAPPRERVVYRERIIYEDDCGRCR